MKPTFTRRRFFQAGAAGVVIASLPLRAGMPLEATTMELPAIQSASRVYQYTLSVPWDWTTATFDPETHDLPYPHDSFEGFPSIAFNPDGTEMYVTGADSFQD